MKTVWRKSLRDALVISGVSMFILQWETRSSGTGQGLIALPRSFAFRSIEIPTTLYSLGVTQAGSSGPGFLFIEPT